MADPEPWRGWSIRIAGIQIYEKEDDRGIEGHVLYELWRPCQSDCSAEHALEGRLHSPAVVGLPYHTEFRYLTQPFHSGGQRYYKGASAEDIAENRANIWAWNNDRERPSLTPSFYFLGRSDPKGRYPDWPAVHTYLTQGKLVDSGCDATIRD